jgi:hypothetical protein
MIDCQGKCELLADIKSLFINQRQAIGIRILAESNHRSPFEHMAADAGEVLTGWLWRMVESSIRLSPKQDDIAPEFLEDARPDDTSSPMVGIQKHFEPAIANPLDIH